MRKIFNLVITGVSPIKSNCNEFNFYFLLLKILHYLDRLDSEHTYFTVQSRPTINRTL